MLQKKAFIELSRIMKLSQELRYFKISPTKDIVATSTITVFTVHSTVYLDKMIIEICSFCNKQNCYLHTVYYL